jgi:hypothetical protein
MLEKTCGPALGLELLPYVNQGIAHIHLGADRVNARIEEAGRYGLGPKVSQEKSYGTSYWGRGLQFKLKAAYEWL